MEIKNGPITPDKFAYAGVVYPVNTPLVWRLIDHVWRKPGRRVSVDSLAQGVWSDANHDISYLALATLRRNANRFFKSNSLPFQMRTRQEEVMLLNTPTVKESTDGKHS